MSQAEPDDRVDALLARWLEMHRSGKHIECDALLHEHGELAADVAEFVGDYERVDAQFEPLRRLAGSTPRSAAEVPTMGHSDTVVPPPPTAGRSFGDYDLLAEVARGGMGVVYKARQRSLNRIVALKMVLGGERGSAIDRDRFLVEARAVARLNHPHIVPIYEVGQCEGQSYFTMEFLAGGSLRERMADLRCDQRVIARLMSTVARGVEHAHRRGILHRDLKPSNVLLDERLEPHITDFGLAKQLDDETDLTQAGAIVGTPSYMAPEQVNSETDLTTAVDVYGLGAVLYELLTGQPPFSGDNPLETMLAVTSRDAVMPRRRAPEIAEDLETICLKCLAKDSLARYGSAEALAADLDRWLAGEPIEARRATRAERLVKWSRRQPVLAGSLATIAATVLGLLVLAGFLWQNAEARAQAVKSLDEVKNQLIQLDDQRKAAQALADQQQKLADEQRKIADQQKELADKTREEVNRLQKQADDEKAKANTAREEARVALAALRATSIQQVKAAAEAKSTLDRAKRDARRIGYAADMLYAHSAVGHGDLRTGVSLLERQRPTDSQEDLRGFEWKYLWRLTHAERMALQPASDDVRSTHRVVATAVSPDGRSLAAATAEGSIKVWKGEDGAILQEISGPAKRVVGLSFSAEGNRLTAVVDKAESFKDSMDAMLAESKQRPSLARFGRSYELMTWTVGGPLEAHVDAFDPAMLRGIMSPVFSGITGPFQFGLEGKYFQISVAEPSPDGNLLAIGGMSFSLPQVAGWQGQVLLWDSKTQSVKRRLDYGGPVASLAFSPDGGTLAISGYFSTVELWDVAGGKKRITIGDDSKEATTCVAFSTDGRQLAAGDASGTVILWDAVGGQRIGVLAGHLTAISSMSFTSADHLLITGSADGAVKVWDTAGAAAPLRLRGPAENIDALGFSPDGSQITAVNKRGALKSWDVRTADVQSDVKGGAQAVNVAVSPDANEVAQLVNGELKLRTIATGQERMLDFKFPAGQTELYFLMFSADGKSLLAGLLDGRLKVWDAATGALHGEYRKPAKAELLDLFAVLAPNGETLAYPQADGVLLWNFATGTERTVAPGAKIDKVAFSTDGKRLATTSARTLAIWDVESGQQQFNAELTVRNAYLDCIAFSPDGRRLAFGGLSTQIGLHSALRLWDTASGLEVLSVPPWKGQLKALTFSPDGRRLAAASIEAKLPFQTSTWETTIQIWDAAPIAAQKEP